MEVIIVAKRKTDEKFTKAVIDYENMTITEVLKDEEREYDLHEVLKRWDNIHDISMTFSTDEEIPVKDE